MSRLRRGALALLTALLFLTTYARAEDDPATALSALIDGTFAQYGVLGACVAILENGEITYAHAYGLRDPDGESVTEDTLFRVGSISKLVAGMGVMRLVGEGALSLDDDLGELFGFAIRHPDFPDERITLRQVMTHTASLRDSGAYNLALKGTVRPLDELFSDAQKGYVFLRGCRPGTSEKYSNFGGGLLGGIIERATGQTVDQYLGEALFAPLGITAAFQGAALPEDAPVANLYAMPSKRLTARIRDGAPLRTEPSPLTDYTLTAGKLTISAPDLAKLLIALCDGGVCGDARVLTESAALEMRTPQNARGSVDCDSGRGLCMNIIADDQVRGRTLYGHGGKAYGMLCAAYFDPDDRTGVVMLTNGCRDTSSRNGVGRLGRAVLTLCYEQYLDGRHVTENPFWVE